MYKLFSPDSKLMQVLKMVSSTAILNILYLICCIPVFTVGAATTALYTVCFQMRTPHENGIIKPFFQAFRAKFLQSTGVWLVLLIYLFCSAFNLFLVSSQGGIFSILYGLFFVLAMIGVLVFSYAFPMISQFRCTFREILRNSFFLGFAFLPRSLLMIFLHVLPFALLLFQPELYLSFCPLWFVCYYTVTANIVVDLLKNIFASHLSTGEKITQ